MWKVASGLGRGLARFLGSPGDGPTRLDGDSYQSLLRALQPCDVLLVEGHSRVSTAIKYLTQSTWSHAALFVGPMVANGDDRAPPMLIEADLQRGIVAVPLNKYTDMRTRICRPVGLGAEARQRVIAAAVARLGHRYDLRNVFDLARYVVATPPVPTRWRRRMLALGSGDPTRAICSTMIAQAFQSVRYPILPVIERRPSTKCDDCVDEILHIRHHSLFAPRDFDLSPYFAVVKPALLGGFEYQKVRWSSEDGVPVPQ